MLLLLAKASHLGFVEHQLTAGVRGLLKEK